MSILGKIFGRIFPQAKAAQAPTAPAGQAAPANTGTASTTAQAPVGVQAPQPTQAKQQPVQGGTATMERVDVEQILDEKAAQKGQGAGGFKGLAAPAALTSADAWRKAPLPNRRKP